MSPSPQGRIRFCGYELAEWAQDGEFIGRKIAQLFAQLLALVADAALRTTNRGETVSRRDFVTVRAALVVLAAQAGCGGYGCLTFPPLPELVDASEGLVDGYGDAAGPLDAPAPDGGIAPTNWVLRAGDDGDDQGAAAIADAAGNVFATGTFNGSITFGGDTLTSLGAYDAWVAKFAPDGVHRWSVRIGGGGYDVAADIDVDAAGDVYVIGIFQNTVNFGGGNVTSAGGTDAFILKLDGDDGSFAWVRRIGGTGNDQGLRLASSDDAVFMLGYFQSTVDFGGGEETAGTGGDLFVVGVTAANVFLWANPLPTTGVQDAAGVATVDGDVVVAADFTGTANLGGSSLVAQGQDIFLVRYDGATGGHEWSVRYGASDSESVGRIDACGSNLYVAAAFSGTGNFGGNSLISMGDGDIAIASYVASNGSHRWSVQLGGGSSDGGISATCDDDEVVVTASFSGTISVLGQDYSSAGGSDVLLIRMLPSTGALSAASRFGSTGGQTLNVRLTGSTLVGAGHFEDNAVLFGTEIESAGSNDIVIFSEDF